MLDPFPIPAPSQVAALCRPVANYLGLETLPSHVHEVAIAFLLYHVTCVYISPYISSRICPRSYNVLEKRTKFSWDVHVVSLLQSTIIDCLALWTIWNDTERSAMDFRERVWGYTGAIGLVQAFAEGYFIWDLWITAVHVDMMGWGMLAHATSALWVFSFGYRPFVNYYGPVFILFELSSPFLNFHWFFDKLDMTGSNAQFYNGIVLITSFFFSRLVWGTYRTFHVFSDIWKAMEYQKTIEGRIWLDNIATNTTSKLYSAVGTEPQAEVLRFAKHEVPMWLVITYLGSNIVLMCLKIYWFGKMIETIRKRFEPPLGTKEVEPKKSIVMGRGLSANGRKSVEVDSVEIKQRRTRRKA